MIRRTTACIAASVFILMLMTGCSLLPSTQRSRTPPQGQGGATPTPIPTPIIPIKPVYEVQAGEVIKIVQFTGRVSPVVEQELFFRTGGRVRAVYVKRDEIVTEGQILADLEIDDLERELTSTQLDLERAEQQLTEAEQSHGDALARTTLRLEMAEADLMNAMRDKAFELTKAEIDLRIKELQFTKARNSDLSPRQTLALADLEESHISLSQAQADYDKIAYSDSVGASSQAANLQRATLDFERAQANYDLAMQDINNRDFDLNLMAQEITLAELKIEELEANSANTQLVQSVALAQFEVDILERGLDPIYVNNVERAKLNVEKLEAAINDARIVTPFDGEIVTLSLTEGREATSFKPVVIIADPTELEVSATPLDSQLRDLAEEMPVKITLANQPGQEYAGSIRRLPYPYGGGGRSQGVEDEDTSTRISLELSLVEIGLEQGDLVRIEVVLERKENALWLPPQAVRTFDGRRFVVVQDGEVQRRVDVKVGIAGEDRVEIEEGLTVGQVSIGP